MFKILMLNKIDQRGLDIFPRDNYRVSSKIDDPDAILLRSHPLNESVVTDNLKAIARAGAGTNNVPVRKCSEKGVVVFNTPGANANSVKELVIMSLIAASRQIFKAVDWAKQLSPETDNFNETVEKIKNSFSGREIMGKRLGVIGLGSIGVMVANSAQSLGMEVYGYDPFISIEAAWGLSRAVKRASSLSNIMETCDYITLHVPLNEKTRSLIGKKEITALRDNAVLLNFARNEIIDSQPLDEALVKSKIAAYITDFPQPELVKRERVISIPHLGAATAESEQNCAIMAARQLKDFLEKGIVKNSVNYPNCEMPPSGIMRVLIAGKNIPNIINHTTAVIGEESINVASMHNDHRNGYAFTTIDVDNPVTEKAIKNIKNIEGVINIRVLDLRD